MNQILSFSNTEFSKSDFKKVVKFFAIFILLLGIIFAVEGVLNLKKAGALGGKEAELKNARIDKPEIKISKEGSVTILKVDSRAGVKKIVYSWNDGEDSIIEKAGEKQFEERIDSLNGTNNLNIKIVDAKDNTINYNPIKITYDVTETPATPTVTEQQNVDWQARVANDKTKPTIELSSASGKVVIKASDETLLSYVTYKWNESQEFKVTGLSEDEKSLTTEIDALVGDNQLVVTAYDKAGNTEQVTKKVHGTSGPKIKALKKDGQIIVKVEDEYKITKIEYEFNGEKKTIDNINQTNYELKLDLKDGQNYIVVDAYEGNVKNTYKGKTNK